MNRNNPAEVVRVLKRLIAGTAGAAALLLITGCSVLGVNSVEEASYRVLDSQEQFELREYPPLVVAETRVDATFKKAGNVAFRRLFRYIAGENQAKQTIAMSAPVVGDSGSGEKIDMTAPVMGEAIGESWRYWFFLPEEYSVSSAPVPLDEQVRILLMPARKVAVLRFSGLVSQADVDKKSAQLAQWIKDNEFDIASEPRWAGYNPPWTLPFLRRNEVMMDVLE